MPKFAISRLLQAIPVLWAVATLTFFMVRLAPGDPFSDERQIPEEIQASLNARYGFDAPLRTQYFRYMAQLLKGDLGPSYKHPGRSVNEIIASAFPVSLELGLYGLIVALCVGIPAGVIAAVRCNSVFDYVPMTLAMTGICLPSFVLGPLLALVFGLHLGWFNPMGWSNPGDRVLPALTLGLFYAAYIARLTRAGMLDVLSQDFIRTARAKGLSEKTIIFKHALRNSMIPVITIFASILPILIGGSLVIEVIFDLPGMGEYMFKGLLKRDYNIIMATMTLSGVMTLMGILLSDIAYAIVDPRIKYS